MRLVLDWDGTVTETDTQLMVLERFGDPALFREAEEGLVAGRLTLRKCMDLEYQGVHASLDEVNSYLLEQARIRPGFRELAAAHRPLILSSGFVENIQPLLEREGVTAEVLANSVEVGPDGWHVRWRDETVCAVCDEACKRGSLPGGAVAYVGDGVSDHCAALAAHRIFAIDGLARYLDERGVAYTSFRDLHDVRRALDGAGR
jgi:2-hydroxy-3-keto-5-methylthiopentenyl-1-phosphate phosphatase